MDTYQVQFPLDKTTKALAEAQAEKFGLKGINDTIRFLVTNFAHGRVNVNFDQEVEAYRKELDKASAEVQADLVAGRIKPFMNVDDLMESLKSN